MDPQVAIERLTERVRETAATADPSRLKTALHEELARARRRAHWLEYAQWRDGVDVPGTAYEELIASAVRRPTGQFQTPFWAADVMAGWLLQEPVELLVDPGVGAGRLLFRASQRREDGPRAMLGMDIDPLCIEMARTNLALRGVRGARLKTADFLLDGLRAEPDAIIANPPFSRHHEIATPRKEAIHRAIERRLGIRLSRRTGLHALFLVRALEIAADGARLAFIAPADWLDTHSGELIKRFVLESADVEGIVIFSKTDVVFTGVRTRPAMFFLRKGTGQGLTSVVRLPAKRPTDPDDALAALRGEQSATRRRLVKLDIKHRWSDPRTLATAGQRLGDLARVRRGIATGCNRFFILSEDERQDHHLDRSDLRPCLASPKLVGSVVDDSYFDALPRSTRQWLLNRREPGLDCAPNAYGAYLRLGLDQGAADSYLASARKVWYVPESRGTSPILFPYMNSKRARFIRNRTDAVPLNSFLIIDPHDGVEPDELWNALNSPAILRQLKATARNYGHGMWKLEPRELGRIRITRRL